MSRNNYTKINKMQKKLPSVLSIRDFFLQRECFELKLCGPAQKKFSDYETA